MGADGRFTYTVDNNLPEVQALRMLLDGLVDTFTYTVSDDHGATDQATLRVLILGQNDNPVAHDDAGNAIEAGGRYNATPGADATGNVLDNDTDVDQYGETKAVTAINGPLGAGAVAGTTAGRYGTLTVQADGSYRYVIDNDNAAVQALRTSDETLTETFVYVVADRAGATATATLTITIHGQNDAPVARDDSNNVDNIHGQPITSGNVLPNDSDVDTGDQLTVVGIRPGAKDAGGASTPPGTRIAGSYGYLQINADGSYTYEIDLTNPAVQAAAGRGSILVDVFTYTVDPRGRDGFCATGHLAQYRRPACRRQAPATTSTSCTTNGTGTGSAPPSASIRWCMSRPRCGASSQFISATTACCAARTWTW
jgi:VCBS repeat-containing protein